MSNEARIACGPGLIGITESSTPRSNEARKGKATSFATSSAMQEKVEPMKDKNKTETETVKRAPYCNICAGDHYGVNCEIFMGMNVDDRKAIALKKGVCFKCLRKGHLVKECKRTNSLLFANLPQDDKPVSSQETRALSVESTSFQIDIDTATGYHSPIVPVRVHHKDNPERIIKTYAVLDYQSNGCFIANSLAN